MQGEQLKSVSVNLGTCIPLGRKFLGIREGDRLLMLKALDGTRSIYSIEDQATRSTRSGKQHILYSPTFVNGLEGMNNQKDRGDHVTLTRPSTSSSSSGVSHRPKNYAKKSTGNNIRRTLQQQARTSAERPAHHLLSRDSRQSRSRSRSRSPASIHQPSALQKAEVLQASKVQVRDEDRRKELERKDPRTENPTSTTSDAHRVSQGHHHQDSSSNNHVRRSGGADDKKGPESKDAKATHNHNNNNKENHPKSTVQEPARQTEGDRNKSLTDSAASQKDTSVSTKDEHKVSKSAVNSPPPSNESENPPSANEKDTHTNNESFSSPSKTCRQRASTPTPESPIKKSLINKLSRKRHRSASPKVSTVDKQAQNTSTGQGTKVNKDSIKLDTTKFRKLKKLCSNAINQRKDSIVQRASPEVPKPGQDLCKSAASVTSENEVSLKEDGNPQKASSKSMQKMGSDSTKPMDNTCVEDTGSTTIDSIVHEGSSDLCGPSANIVEKATGTKNDDGIKNKLSDTRKSASKTAVNTKDADRAAQGVLSETPTTGSDQTKPEASTFQKTSQDCNMTKRKHLSSSSSTKEPYSPAPKKQKLSGMKDGQPSDSRSSDSEDGLSKLMKGFRSAMSSSSPQESSNTPRGSPVKPSRSPKSVSEPKSPIMSDSSTSHQMDELDALQTEAVSSDEDFEPLQETNRGMRLQSSTKANSNGKPQKNNTLEVEQKEKLNKYIDKFLVVDEVGYTPSKNVSPTEPSPSSKISRLNKAGDVLSQAKAPNVGDLSEANGPKPDVNKKLKLEGESRTEEKEGVSGEEQKLGNIEEKVGISKVLGEGEPTQTKEEAAVDTKDAKCTVFVLSSKNVENMKAEPKAPVELPPKEGLELKIKEVQEPSLPTVSSTAVQTDLAEHRKEQSCQTEKPKTNVQHQYTQSDGEPAEIDPEEVTRIVSAMVESECEERERLKSALKECTQKEEKWRNMVKDLCRQMRDMREQLAKKEDKIRKDKSTITATAVWGLPCIISSQGSQTEHGKDFGVVEPVSTDERPKSASSAVQSASSNTASPPSTQGPEKNQSVTMPAHSGVSEKPTAGHSAAGKAQNSTVSKPEEVIDLTEGEELTARKKQTSNNTLVGVTQNSTVPPSKTRTTQQKPSFLSILPIQGVPKTTQNKVSQNAATPVTSVNRIPMVANGQIVVSQPSATVPLPPLHPAPNVTLKPGTKQLPFVTQVGNVNRLLPNQGGQQRQNVVLTQQGGMQPQQVLQTQGLTAQQQQQIQNTVIIQGMKRGIIPYQGGGGASIIIPASSQQQQLPQQQQPQQQIVRVSQNQAMQQVTQQVPQQIPVQTQLAALERKKDQLTKQMQQAFGLGNAKQGVVFSNQIQTLLNQITLIKKQQLQRAQPSPAVSSEGNRFSRPAPAYTAARNTQVGQTSNPMRVQQTRNAAQPSPILPTGNTRITNGTWHPIVPQPVQNARSPVYKHPAPLPVLHVFNVKAEGSRLPPPTICVSHSPEGVVLSWNIKVTQSHAHVKNYFLYAYQVLDTQPSTNHWKRIGVVGALAPPMACTLNQFQPGSTYFLAICAVDVYDRPGNFSKTEEVVIPV